MMEELNVQAAVEAGRGGEENVRQTLVEKQKMPLIVHEILVTEIWRENILTRILKQGKPESSFQVSFILGNYSIKNMIWIKLDKNSMIIELLIVILDLHGTIQRSKHV